MLKPATALVLAVVLCMGSIVPAGAEGQATPAKKKKKKKRCRSGYKLKRVKIKHSKKKKLRCVRVKKKKAKGKTPARPKAPSTPQVPTGPSATESLLARHLWWEDDLDRDSVCYLYTLDVGSNGERRGVRTSYFVNPFTGRCRVTSEANAQTSYFSWSVSGNVLTNLFRSGSAERLSFGSFKPSDATVPVNRNGAGVVWAGCNSPYYPFARTPGC